MRVSVHHRRIKADLGQDFRDQLTVWATFTQIMHAQPFGDNLGDGHARAKAAEGVLENDLHVSPQVAQLPRRPPLDVLTLKNDWPLR